MYFRSLLMLAALMAALLGPSLMTPGPEIVDKAGGYGVGGPQPAEAATGDVFASGVGYKTFRFVPVPSPSPYAGVASVALVGNAAYTLQVGTAALPGVLVGRQQMSHVAINATNYSIPSTGFARFYTAVNGNAQNITLPNPNLLPVGIPITICDAAGQAASNTIAVNSSNTTGAGNVGAAAFGNITAAYGQRTYTTIRNAAGAARWAAD